MGIGRLLGKPWRVASYHFETSLLEIIFIQKVIDEVNLAIVGIIMMALGMRKT